MPIYKFKSNDIFHNRIKVHPRQTFQIWNGRATLNNETDIGGVYTGSIRHVPLGHVSAHEINIDRQNDQLVYPFITKSGARESFKTVSLSAFGDYEFGTKVTGSYPLSASISKLHFQPDQGRSRITALKNTLNYYAPLSRHYLYSSSLGNKADQHLGLVSVPSIFYGSSIKKGTVDLKFYVTGTLVGQAQDTKQNGELIEVSGTSVGSVAGVVLYNEGFLALTGGWNLSTSGHTEAYSELGAKPPSWVYFGQSISGSTTANSSSFTLGFQGTDYVPTITMLAHAPRGELNHSNNPTYAKYNSNRVYATTSSLDYVEPEGATIKNVVSSSYQDHTASFEKHTYISKIGVYDRDRNLIGIAKLATPVKKTENREFTFKLKLDI